MTRWKVAVCGFMVATIGVYIRYGCMIYNPTPSAPIGYYWRTAVRRPVTRGMYVLHYWPESILALAETQQWLPKGWPLLKPIAGIPGDQVCIHHEELWINGEYLAPVYLAWREIELPQLRGCFIIAEDEVFLASTRVPISIDSRYYGSVKQQALLATVVPLWTW